MVQQQNELPSVINGASSLGWYAANDEILITLKGNICYDGQLA